MRTHLILFFKANLLPDCQPFRQPRPRFFTKALRAVNRSFTAIGSPVPWVPPLVLLIIRMNGTATNARM
jgi:hypothetical protein